MSVKYMDSEKVSEVKRVKAPLSGRTVSGYGAAIPMDYMVRYAGRWRRVYCMVYGNSGAAYIKVRGQVRHLDIDTEYRLQDLSD